jgi:hypothetical protein
MTLADPTKEEGRCFTTQVLDFSSTVTLTEMGSLVISSLEASSYCVLAMPSMYGFEMPPHPATPRTTTRKSRWR